MKLLLLHGPAIASSRQKLSEVRKKFDQSDVLVFEKGSDTGNILAALQTTPMFGDEQLIILENPPENLNFDSLPPSASLASGGTHNESLTLTIWFDKEVDPQKYPKAQVFFFPEIKEISVFPFLDMLGQRDKKAFLELDKLKKAGYESQYFITMIFYLLRNLVVTPQKAADFVKKKNARLRENFSREELMGLYRNILEIDFKIKSGLLETAQADFSMVRNFLRD